MIDIYYQIVFYLGFLCVVVGCLFSIAALLMAADYAITLIVKCLKVYPALMDFIWNRTQARRQQ